MRRGFTMIELIFVIVILGILASVAIPRLAATRDDARAAGIKTDIGTAIQAIPAWFQGQKEVAFQNAMSIDTKLWVQNDTKCEYVFTDDAGGKVTMMISKDNNVTPLDSCPEDNASIYGDKPMLLIKLEPDVDSGIVKTLKDDMGVSDSNITLAGKRVKW